ncbi:hypothetical protein PQ462_17085 [Flavobacterium sp. KACC 22758]|uniref:hypothetical protein n=1 Tax=Flavobacterium sp. KACC 22758 TaxID=3025667 RepID=UPI0023652203|nr:hypothetical protein [Flavobacterium sp. KACC 22758]WDF58430.1 hypothetical protein PQ462_17085 [Flavobacterium sp. KACC 22758]
MANSFYSYSAYISPSSNADIKVLKEFLDEFYQESDNKITLNDNQITITFDDEYNFYIYLAEEEHVNQEALEIADYLEEDWNETPSDKEKLKASKKRFEVWGDPDFDMDYFNDSLFIIDQVEKFNDIIIFQNQ